jgi:hypothetical protein
MESPTSEPISSTPQSPPQGKQLVFVFVQSVLIGLAFVPIVIAVLFVCACYEWWRYAEWDIFWIYERGGFPCLGLFAITSASYFSMRLMPCRFFLALLIVASGACLCWILCGTLDFMPRMFKGPEIHWMRPAFIAWLLIPPWLTAIAAISVGRRSPFF